MLAAAAAQTVRNAAQKDLTRTAGTIAATSVRFIYGLPFALIGLAIALHAAPGVVPTPNRAFLAWVSAGALAQLVATALLLAAMQQRSFVVAVAFSKTEVLQVALLSIILLGESITAYSAAAIMLASIAVVMLTVGPNTLRNDAPATGWLSSSALLGIGSGAGFALSAVGYRGATLALGPMPAWLAGSYALVWAQAIQSLLIAAFLLWRDRAALKMTVAHWRVSLLAGAAGALASLGWFTAFALRNAADVRTLALVEILFGYAVSWRVFKEKVSAREALGIGLLMIGVVLISMQL